MGIVQIARPDGNAFERWKWRHRYFIWTWSLSGAVILFLRAILDPRHPRLDFLSWFTLSSYLIAIPVAIALGALYALVFSTFYRIRDRFRTRSLARR
ncbi:MAG: hypothetical protein NVS9B14_06630 [Candidatus Acidiferrum sp.]